MLHIWHEDKNIKSCTAKLWKFLSDNNVHDLLKNSDIHGFNGKDNLLRYLETYEFTPTDVYLIFVDCVFDNHRVMHTYFKVKKITDRHKNVVLSDLVCAEYLFLKFGHFEEWLKPTRQCTQEFSRLLHLRELMLAVVDQDASWCHYSELRDFASETSRVQNAALDTSVTAETVIHNLLSKCTYTLRGFECNKTQLGTCWTCDCCNAPRGYPNNNSTPPCNIFDKHFSSVEKAIYLYLCTPIVYILLNIVNMEQ